MKKNEQGMIVVEATLSLTVFVVVLAAIIMLINLFTIHNKVQYSITQAATEIASYGYLYDAFELRAADQQVNEDGSASAGALDDTVTQVIDSIGALEQLYGSGQSLVSGDSDSMKSAVGGLVEQTQGTYDSVKASAEMLSDLFSNPQDLLNGLIYMGVNRAGEFAKSVIAASAGKALTEKYLDMSYVSEDGRSADAYLRSYGVVDGFDGLDFGKSTAFCDSDYRLVDLVVEYDMEIPMLNLLGISPQIHVVQRVSIPAWTGDGSGYAG